MADLQLTFFAVNVPWKKGNAPSRGTLLHLFRPELFVLIVLLCRYHPAAQVETPQLGLELVDGTAFKVVPLPGERHMLHGRCTSTFIRLWRDIYKGRAK